MDRSSDPEGPDFSTVDTVAKAEDMCLEGELEQMLMLPEEFGGTDDPRNILFVPVGMVAIKENIDLNVIQPLLAEGKVRRYSVTPEYRGKSMVPIALQITAEDPGKFTTTLNIWGEALRR
jgi:hypothetical protein